jgi:guanylate kinase
MRKTPLIFLCGTSGVGKTTISYVLRDLYGLKPVISHTSRPIRPDEVDGVDYHFRSKEWMEAHRELFSLDWRTFNGNHYGATDDALITHDVIVINSDDVAVLRDKGLPVFFIWVEGPSRTPRSGRKDEIRWKPEYVSQVNHILMNQEGRSLESCAKEVHAVWELIRPSIRS